jgi:predicted PurR-regulated permease PerM
VEKEVRFIYRITIIFLLLLCIYVFLKLEPIWLPIVVVIIKVSIPLFVAATITYLLHPIVEYLHKRRVPRGLAVLFIYIIFFGGVGFAFYKGAPHLIKQLRDLGEQFPQFANTYRNWIHSIHDRTEGWPNGLHERIEEGIKHIEDSVPILIDKAITSIKQLLDYVILLAVIPFIVFYLLKDYQVLKKAAWYVTPRKWRKSGLLLLKDIDHSLGSYIRGQLLVCTAIGTLATISFMASEMPYPILLGFIIGTTNIIPYFGPVIGAIPAVVIALTISIKMVIIIIVIILALQFLEGNVLSPLIVGKSLHMHPIFIIIALLIGGEVGGIVGLILAVPLLSVMKVVLLHSKEHLAKH